MKTLVGAAEPPERPEPVFWPLATLNAAAAAPPVTTIAFPNNAAAMPAIPAMSPALTVGCAAPFPGTWTLMQF